MKPTKDKLLTVGELRRHLEGIPDDARIIFGCDSLQFYRIKPRGSDYYQIEFSQSVWDDDKGDVFVTNVPQ